MVTEKIKILDAKLIFKNFAGKEGAYNAAGKRNFGVLLDDLDAKELEEVGWRIRFLKPRADDPEEYRQPWLKVNVNYEGKIPPTVVLVNSKGRIRLNETTIDQLDWTRIKHCDVSIRPYNYPAMPGRPAGVSAYLDSIYVTVLEDELEERYADIPWIDEES